MPFSFLNESLQITLTTLSNSLARIAQHLPLHNYSTSMSLSKVTGLEVDKSNNMELLWHNVAI